MGYEDMGKSVYDVYTFLSNFTVVGISRSRYFIGSSELFCIIYPIGMCMNWSWQLAKIALTFYLSSYNHFYLFNRPLPNRSVCYNMALLYVLI